MARRWRAFSRLQSTVESLAFRRGSSSVFAGAAVMLVPAIVIPSVIVATPALWLGATLFGTLTLWLIAAHGSAWAARFAGPAALPAAARRRLVAFGETFAAGVGRAWPMRKWLQLAGLSVGVLLLPALANQLLLYAFGLAVPLWAGLALLLVLQIGSVPPSLPGRLGIFNCLTVVTLEWLGVDRLTAVSYSIVLYVIAYVPKLLIGAVWLAMPAPSVPRRVVPRSIT